MSELWVVSVVCLVAGSIAVVGHAVRPALDPVEAGVEGRVFGGLLAVGALTGIAALIGAVR